MNAKRSISTVILAAAVMPLTGCIGWWGPIDVEWSVRQSAGVSMHKEFGVNVGPAMIGLAGAFVGDSAPVDISHISSVDVGVYKITSSEHRSLRELELADWERMVRVRDDHEDVLILVKTGGDKLRALLVIARDGDELVIAKIHGRIDKLLEEAMQHTDGDFNWENFAGVEVN